MMWKQNLSPWNLDSFKYIEVGLLYFLGTGEANLQEADSLLEPYLQKFPNVCISNTFYNRSVFPYAQTPNWLFYSCLFKGSIILFYAARIDVLKGNFEKVNHVLFLRFLFSV